MTTALAVRPDRRRRGHLGEVQLLVDRLLPAVGVDLLGEIALRVEEAHADERQPQIAGRLAVIARQDAQAAGVDRQRLVQAEFGREVGDQAIRLLGVRPRIPGHRRRIHVGVERGHDRLVARQVGRIGRRRIELALAHQAQELDGVVVDLRPQMRVNALEKILGSRIPAPPQVVCQIGKPCDPGPRRGVDRHLANSSHNAPPGKRLQTSKLQIADCSLQFVVRR